MSVRIVRTKSGEDIICDLHEVVTKDEKETVIGFQLSKPYTVFLESAPQQEEFLVEGESPIQQVSETVLMMEPWIPLAAKPHVIVRADEIVTVYDALPDVIEKYNELVEVSNGRERSETDSSENEE